MGIYLNTKFQNLHNKQVDADNFYASHQLYKQDPFFNQSIKNMFPLLGTMYPGLSNRDLKNKNKIKSTSWEYFPETLTYCNELILCIAQDNN